MRYFYLSLCLCLIGCAADSVKPHSSSSPVVQVLNAEMGHKFEWPRSYEYMPEGAVLVFSATGDWRHDSGVAGASAFWARLTDETGTGFFMTEHAGVFTEENLAKFNTIIFNSVTGDVLNATQQRTIETFVENGGGLIAQHGAGDSTLAKTWPWWAEQFGTEFISHPADPQFQTADVVTLASEHPVMRGVGDKFSHSDEWYTFSGPVRGDVIVLAGLDEKTYAPVNNVYGPSDLRMGPNPSDHPIIWAKCPGQGRMIYSGLGHKADSYDTDMHRLILTNALAWVQQDVAAGGDAPPSCP